MAIEGHARFRQGVAGAQAAGDGSSSLRLQQLVPQGGGIADAVDLEAVFTGVAGAGGSMPSTSPSAIRCSCLEGMVLESLERMASALGPWRTT